jgi:hypothetical protein
MTVGISDRISEEARATSRVPSRLQSLDRSRDLAWNRRYPINTQEHV